MRVKRTMRYLRSCNQRIMRYQTCGKNFSRGVMHGTEKSLWVTSVSGCIFTEKNRNNATLHTEICGSQTLKLPRLLLLCHSVGCTVLKLVVTEPTCFEVWIVDKVNASQSALTVCFCMPYASTRRAATPTTPTPLQELSAADT